MGLRDWWRRAYYGPPTPPIPPPVRRPIEQRAWGPYAWSYPPGWALAASSGPLIHGPGAYPWGQRESTALAGSNSVVYACLAAIGKAYTEAPLKHFKGFGDRKREIEGSPVLDLLRLPNVPSEAMRRPAINWRTMEKYRQVCLHVHGNAYIRKLRNPAGEVVQLWPVNPLTVTPMTDKDSSSFIDFYRRRISPNRYEDIPVADMIHDRLALDDADHRLGLSPLRAAIREVSTDAIATRFAERLLGNDARPGTVVSVDKEAQLPPGGVNELRDQFVERYSGEGVGQVAFVKGATAIDRLTFSPDELDLAAIHRIPETRICAVLGVPPGLVGVWAGLERNTYSNAVEMREAFYEGTIVPLYIDGQTALTEQLLRDFGARDDEYLEYDVGELRAFATDENADAVRIATLYEKGIITLNEARGEAGFDTVEGGDESPAKPVPAVPPPPPGNDGQNAPQASPNGTGAAKALALEVRRVSLDDFPALLEALRQSQGEQVTKRVQAYLDSQARRVARAVAEVG
jgi:HK97 family phage portal protein